MLKSGALFPSLFIIDFCLFFLPKLFQNGINLTLFQVHSIERFYKVKGSKNFFHPK